MTQPTLHLRLAGDAAGAWRAIALPPLPQPGIHAAVWTEVSVSAALAWIQRTHDPGLAAVLSCRRGLCALCAVRIDGQVVTACTTPVRDGMRIEPARGHLALSGVVVDVSLVRRARV